VSKLPVLSDGEDSNEPANKSDSAAESSDVRVLVGARDSDAEDVVSVCPSNLSVMDVSGGVLTRPLSR
jgi:hypothetical protein